MCSPSPTSSPTMVVRSSVENVGSPEPRKYRSPLTSPPAGRGGPLAGPTAATVVRQRYSGPSSDSAALVVTILTFDAAFRGVLSSRAYSVLPLSASSTTAEILALASAGALKTPSISACSQACRSAGIARPLGSALAPGRGANPMSGRAPGCAGGVSGSAAGAVGAAVAGGLGRLGAGRGSRPGPGSLPGSSRMRADVTSARPAT